MLSRFYAISGLNDEGVPADVWRQELETVRGAPTA